LASNRNKLEQFFLPALFAALLASCASAPKVPSRIEPFALLGDSNIYARLDMARVEGLVLDTVEGVFGAAAAADLKRSAGSLNEVYLGMNVVKSTTNMVVTGSFTPLQYKFIFTTKNGWEKTTVKGESRSYEVYRPMSSRKEPSFLVYAGLSGILLVSTDMAGMLERLYERTNYPATHFPLWLTDPLPEKSANSRGFAPFQVYVPLLAPVAGNSALQNLLSDGLLSKATVEINADPLRMNNAWALNATLDVDVQNSSLQNAAAIVLGVLLLPFSGTVHRGDGSHLIIENFIVSQEKLQETLVNVLKKW
jgi:hypothetical protein